jgi:plastocyanin
MRRPWLWIVAALIVIAAVAAIVTSGDNNNSTKTTNPPPPASTAPPPSASNQTSIDKVSIQNMSFSPDSITVKKGTTVTWTNNDSTTHTVTADSGSGPKSGNLASSDTYNFTFNTTGTFNYHCSIHPSMTGKVTVTD